MTPRDEAAAGTHQDIIFLKQELPSPKLIAEAEKLQLPRCFYLYESKLGCTGCIGCSPNDFKFEDIGKQGDLKKS